MTLLEALQTRERVMIQYKCGSIHKGRIMVINGCYYLAYNSRSLVATRIDLDRVWSIRYANSRVYLFRALGRKHF